MAEGKLFLAVFLYLIAYAIDPFLMVVAFIKYLKPKKKSKLIYFFCFLGMHLLIVGKQYLVLFTRSKLVILFFPLFILCIIIEVKFVFEANFKNSMVILIALLMVNVVTDGITFLLFNSVNISQEQIFEFGLSSAIINLSIRVIDAMAYLIINNFCDIIRKTSRNTYMIMIYACLYSSSIVLLYLYGNRMSENILLCTYCTQALLIIMIAWYFVSILQTLIIREQEANKRAKLSESKMSFINYSKETNEEIKAIRHDMKRHYNYLLELNRRGDSASIEQYLLELSDQLSVTEELYACDNLILSVALSSAQKKAKQCNITFLKSITVNTFPFTDIEFNSIITNVLDNAFEAVSKVTEGERMVKLEIRKINEQEIMIFCQNTYRKEVYEDSPFLATIKWDKDNHGYGTKIVKKIVKQYKGTAIYWKDDQKFYVKIIVGGKQLE